MPDNRTLEIISVIEQCASIADLVADELTAIKLSSASRKSQYDRQTKIKLVFAIRWVRRIARRIRALTLDAPSGKTIAVADDNLLEIARAILRELKPQIAAARDSRWRRRIFHQIDLVLGSNIDADETE